MKVGANIGWEPNTWTFTCFDFGGKAVPKGKWKCYSYVSCGLQWSVALKCPRHQHLFSRPGFGIDFWWVFWQSNLVNLIFVCSELCEIHKFETSPSLSALPGASLGARSTGPLAALWKMSNKKLICWRVWFQAGGSGLRYKDKVFTGLQSVLVMTPLPLLVYQFVFFNIFWYLLPVLLAFTSDRIDFVFFVHLAIYP